MNKDLREYIDKKFGKGKFEVLSFEKSGKDWNIVLDFGSGDKMGITVREWKGDNGNYRVTAQWDESESKA